MAGNVQSLQSDVRETLKKFRALEKHISTKERKKVLRLGAKVLVDTVRRKVETASEDVYRYSTAKVRKGTRAPKGKGNVVAVYTPGNAARSYKVLPLRKTSDIVVGPKVPRSGSQGVFSGQRVDGYYFHMLEYGTKYMSAMAPIRKGIAEAKAGINAKLVAGFGRHMRAFEAKNTLP